MKERMITDVLQHMLPYLDNSQLFQLRDALEHTLYKYEISENSNCPNG